jgi:hypothetical protein
VRLANVYEQVELLKPEGLIKREPRQVSCRRNISTFARDFVEWGQIFPVNVPLDRVDPDDFDALLVQAES